MKSRMRKLLVAAVLGIAFVSAASADLIKQIDTIINRPSQKKVQFSIRIVKADSGKTVYSHNAKRALVPASNMKIITTAAALKFLGPDYDGFPSLLSRLRPTLIGFLAVQYRDIAVKLCLIKLRNSAFVIDVYWQHRVL